MEEIRVGSQSHKKQIERKNNRKNVVLNKDFSPIQSSLLNFGQNNLIFRN